MPAMTYMPTGSAPNADAERQGLFSSFFFSAANLLDGVDDSPRVGAADSGGMLGPGTSLGFDVGVGNNGEVYLRGRSGQVGTDGTTGATTARRAITPGMLLLLGVAAFLVLRK